MMPSRFAIIIGVISYPVQSQEYSTNFSSFDSSHWTLDACAHCTNHNGEASTQMLPSAITFNSTDGAVITTKILSKTSSCGSICISGHMTFNTNILYGTFIVNAKWYPGHTKDVNTSTGYIGLDSDSNTASIVFGFHGKGWIGDNDQDFAHKFQYS